MAEDLEHILSQLSQPDNAVIQQVMSEMPPIAPTKVKLILEKFNFEGDGVHTRATVCCGLRNKLGDFIYLFTMRGYLLQTTTLYILNVVFFYRLQPS